MIIEKKELAGVFEISLSPRKDDRGFFMRTYDKNIMKENGLDRNWIQENHSKSVYKNTIRGLHLQLPPHSETKLIRCIKGKILDVFVDLRKESETFGKWESVILSEDETKMLFIPRGFAHGFLSLEDNCEVIYKVDNAYAPDNECGIIWNDKDLNIDWGIKNPILSEKDFKNITLKDFIERFKYVIKNE